MASLSLPRVLHPRKTSLEIERELFEKSQQQALNKAINGQETPVKQKHVRSAIIGTYQTQGARIFWSIAIKLPALDDRIVAWKLCHVVHKILREGHPLCLVESQRHKHYLDEIGKLWCHINDGYGKMIKLYTTLLINKLEFHKRNPRFPGHLGVSAEELESIAGNDINNYFEMSVEMFDYVDNILNLQAAVFGSLNMARSNSMTSAGQCRLAPLIPCIQDASKLYDYCVKILFRLHCSLKDPDILVGHRDRFQKIFKQLTQFYDSTSNMQYFKDLISIPPLGEKPPNFLEQSALRTYVTHEVVVPQELEDEAPMEGSLIDTSDGSDRCFQPTLQDITETEVFKNIQLDNEHLKNQVEKLRTENAAFVAKSRQEKESLRNRIVSLETDLAMKESEFMQERQVKEELMNQAFATVQSQDSEQKVKEEKFNKLKDFYYKLRDDHIQKIREKADVDKKLSATIKKVDELERAKLDLELKLTDLSQNLCKAEEKVQQAANLQNDELENLKKDKELFNMETEILKKSVTDVCKERDDLKIELNHLNQEKEELRTRNEELSYKLLDCETQVERTKREIDQLSKEMVVKSIANCEEILKNAIHEIDNPALTALTCGPDYLRSLTTGCVEALEMAKDSTTSKDGSHIVIVSCIIAHRIAMYILHGRATCNTSPDISFGEKMAEACKMLGDIALKLLQQIKEKNNTNLIIKEAKNKLKEIELLADNITTTLRGTNAENLADMLEREMAEMDKAIEEAANKFQDMLTTSKAADSGVKLEVNSKILDTCTELMKAIRILVQKSRLLQFEIISQGRGTASAKEFYKRNHQWTDGFISAAKAIAVAAKFLLTSADKVVTAGGKLEQLVVAAQEISASTAQLVVASRVKADRKSSNLQQLTQASKGVTEATGNVVATAKNCRILIDEAEELDTSNLTLHQAKKLEMEAQVRVLELEKELELERYRLSALRKHHYQLDSES